MGFEVICEGSLVSRSRGFLPDRISRANRSLVSMVSCEQWTLLLRFISTS